MPNGFYMMINKVAKVFNWSEPTISKSCPTRLLRYSLCLTYSCKHTRRTSSSHFICKMTSQSLQLSKNIYCSSFCTTKGDVYWHLCTCSAPLLSPPVSWLRTRSPKLDAILLSSHPLLQSCKARKYHFMFAENLFCCKCWLPPPLFLFYFLSYFKLD